MSSGGLIAALRRLLPADRLLTTADGLHVYESDGLTAFAARPDAVAIVENADEVVTIVRLCAEHEVPFVARGSGTSLSGGSLPIPGGIVIALNRLNRILAVDPVRRVAVVEPGVINLHVTRAAEPHGLYYAPDPSSQQVCTIGGNVAFNSGGAHCLKYGMTANHVLGVKAVLPDGQVVALGGASLETVGPDVTGFFVGCEGLFGVALEITLRLLPRAACWHTVLAGYRSLEAAGDGVARIVAAGLLPEAMEIMDRLAIDAAEAAVEAGYPAAAQAVLIVELAGTAEQVAADRSRLGALIEASGAFVVRVARDEADRGNIWRGRKSAFSAIGRLSPDFLVQDGVVPRSKLGYVLKRIGAIGQAHGLRVANVFHAGDGNLHPLILYDGQKSGELGRAEQVAAEILRLCISLGGSITGEHGVGMEKRAFMPELFDGDSLDTMKRLRHAVDPLEIANRGKVFPAPGSGAPGSGAPGSGAGGMVPGTHGLHPLEQEGRISRL